MSEPLDLAEEDRNPTYVDWWSLTHIAWGAILVVFFGPFWALAALVLWEPLEVLVLSRIAARIGCEFGHETLRNSLMDLIFDVVGVLVGVYLAVPLAELLMT